MPSICLNSDRLRGPDGLPGENGKEVSESDSPIWGIEGVKGDAQFLKAEYSDYSKRVSLPWIAMQLHRCELDYLNNKINATSKRLIFIYSVVNSLLYVSGNSSHPTQAILIDGHLKNEIENYLKRISLLMIQISQNLDYYGYYSNHVPLISLEIYKSFITELFDIGEKLEKSYEIFSLESTENNLKKSQLLIAIDALKSKTIAKTNEKKQLEVELEDTRSQIDALLNQQIELTYQLKNAGDSFRKAVSEMGGCDFEDILKAGIAVAAIATGIGAVAGGAAGVAAISDKVREGQVKNSLLGRAKYLAGEFREIKGGLLEIKEGYLSIRELLQSDQDGAKLMLAKDEFEDTIKQFIDLDEAKVYRDLMRGFLNVVDVRNKQILFADAILSRLYEIDTEADLIKTEVQSTQNRLIDTVNPITSENIIFFERALDRTKNEILRVLNMYAKALAYWSLKMPEYSEIINDRSITHLRALHGALSSRHLKEIEERNGAPNSFVGPGEIIFSRDKNSDLFDLLDKTSQMTFNISEKLTQYRALAGVLVKTVKISIKGLNFEDTALYTCILTHHGNPKFVTRFGESIEFRHRRRIHFAFYDSTDVNTIELGGLQGVYSYLSPFATWSISIKSDNDQIQTNTTSITEIGLTFSGVAYARYT